MVAEHKFACGDHGRWPELAVGDSPQPKARPVADRSTRVQPGDVILAVNQERFRSLDEFKKLIAQRKKGESVALLVRRGDSALYIPMELGAG